MELKVKMLYKMPKVEGRGELKTPNSQPSNFLDWFIHSIVFELFSQGFNFLVFAHIFAVQVKTKQ